ncbi:MAG: glycosyltransferase, partial [bacterium]|nr:glycosyltransferase [bacterium]
MKLSIIIVNWNVKDYLKKCLESIYVFVPVFPFEVYVIDNASQDGSADMVRQNFPQVNCVTNPDNKGFAAACNQGIVLAKGEYLLFLNPDTTVQGESLEKLVSFLDDHQKAGVAAPQLLDENGHIQPSVREFPTPLTALKAFFQIPQKLDIAYFETREVDQPMGACLLIRKSVLETVGGFDEKFFLWYEEVDLCKRIKNAGYQIFYVPDAKVMHWSGRSFKQKRFFEKQKMNYTSYAYYLKKHFGLKALLPYVLMKTYVQALSHPLVSLTVGVIILAELLSFLGYGFPLLKLVGFFLFTILALILSLKNLTYGVAFALGELIIGSKGHLFSLPISGVDVSVRVGIFCVVIIAWILGMAIRKHEDHFSFLKSRFIKWYALLGVFIVWGIIQGIIQHNTFSNLFSDANAWLYFLFAFPLYTALRSQKEISVIMNVAKVALYALLVKTFFFLYIMTHQTVGQDVVYTLYRWLRTTGVGEITQFEWGGVRVFFQSHIYAVIAFFVCLPAVQRFIGGNTKDQKRFLHGWKLHKYTIMLLVGCTAAIALSFSRSFWVVSAITYISWVVFSLFQRVPWRSLIDTVSINASIKFISLVLLIAVSAFPFPQPTGIFGISSFAKRFQDIGSEAAAASRWSLLPVLTSAISAHPFLGYGFGKTLTYTSFDPRVRELEKTGTFTTYAFEWGYLDVVIKIGVG